MTVVTCDADMLRATLSTERMVSSALANGIVDTAKSRACGCLASRMAGSSDLPWTCGGTSASHDF